MHDAHLEKNIFESGDDINWKWEKKGGQEQSSNMPTYHPNYLHCLLTYIPAYLLIFLLTYLLTYFLIILNYTQDSYHTPVPYHFHAKIHNGFFLFTIAEVQNFSERLKPAGELEENDET